MIIGVPKEIKTREYRVGLVPGGAAALIARGHQVFVEKNAGTGSGIPDSAYEAVGARIEPLPIYSPDKTPIEEMFSKVKGQLRTWAARTIATVLTALGAALVGLRVPNASAPPESSSSR